MGTTGGAVKIGVDSIALPGQLIASPPITSLIPYSFAATGQGVQFPAPSVPPAMGSMSVAGGPSSINTVGNFSTASNRGVAAAIAAQKPWSIKHSAVIPATVMLIVGLALMWWIFWRNDSDLREAAGGE